MELRNANSEARCSPARATASTGCRRACSRFNCVECLLASISSSNARPMSMSSGTSAAVKDQPPATIQKRHVAMAMFRKILQGAAPGASLSWPVSMSSSLASTPTKLKKSLGLAASPKFSKSSVSFSLSKSSTLSRSRLSGGMKVTGSQKSLAGGSIALTVSQARGAPGRCRMSSREPGNPLAAALQGKELPKRSYSTADAAGLVVSLCTIGTNLLTLSDPASGAFASPCVSVFCEIQPKTSKKRTPLKEKGTIAPFSCSSTCTKTVMMPSAKPLEM
mmetsp:Transcript_756/g.2045  ORF Transcript_756/g.2045 Transcript_756/m.2045 type:complete len:277 (+) Transcript_756:908-1738(+)